MNKELVKYGVAAQEYKNAHEAAMHTYAMPDESMPSTPLVFPINPYNEDVKKATIILDLGCGVGRNLSWIMENTNAHYIGIDPHPQMLEYFWEVQDKKYQERVSLFSSFKEMEEKIIWKNGVQPIIDVVVCTFVYQHIGFRPPEKQMNVADITKEAMKFCHSNTVWIMYEHDGEEDWIGRWMDECEILPQVYIREFHGIPELTSRGACHLIIFKQR